MKLTDMLAIIGAITGVSSLAWNIYIKLSAGPKLSVKAWPGMKMMPTPPDDPTYIRVTVRNTGTATTTLTTLSFHVYESKRQVKKFKPDQSVVVVQSIGDKTPFKLEVGGEWNGYVNQDGPFTQLIADGKLWCGVYHSFAGEKPEQAKVMDVASVKAKDKKAAAAG